MTHSILLPLDGSALAERAMPLAAGLSAATGATLHVVGVHPHSPPIRPRGDRAVSALQARDAQDLRSRHAYIDRITSQLGAGYRISARGAVIRGSPAAALAGYARDQRTNLVVATTHGSGDFSHQWVGSVADRLVRTAPVPVLLCRAGPADLAPTSLPFRTILVPLDGSHAAEASLAPARDLARSAAATTIRLFMAVKRFDAYVPPGRHEAADLDDISAAHEAIAEGYLHTVAQSRTLRGLNVQTAVVRSGEAAAAIVQAAQAPEISAIVLTTRGLSGGPVERLGGVADKVLRLAPKPVLLCRPRGATASWSPAYIGAAERYRDSACSPAATVAPAPVTHRETWAAGVASNAEGRP